MRSDQKTVNSILAFPHPDTADAEFLEDVLNNMSVGILVMADNDHPLFANSRYLEMYGLKSEGFKSKASIEDLVRGSSLSFSETLIQRYMDCFKDHRDSEIQGYLFSRPIPAEGISKLFDSELIASKSAA